MKTKKQNPPKGGTLTEEQIEWLNECTRGTWKLNPQTGEVDVKGDFNCSEQGLSDFKGVRFGVVKGSFWCYDNLLTSLEGAPREVGESYHCHNNLLTSLVGAPEKVRVDFYCRNNQLTTLEGAPREVGCGFSCENNRLTSLEGAPQKVGTGFFCDNNLLTSLVGAPQKVGGFFCDNNLLTSLVGAPQKVGGFHCGSNLLTSLEGAPQEVGWDFCCGNNPVPERTLKSILSLMQEGASYEEVLRRKWKRYSHKLKSLLYRAEYQWIPHEEHKMFSALNKVNSVLKWI